MKRWIHAATSQNSFDAWYDSLSLADQEKVDNMADDMGLPLYEECSEAELAQLHDSFMSNKEETYASDQLQIEYDGSTVPGSDRIADYFHTDLNSDNISSIKNIFDALFEAADSKILKFGKWCEFYFVINYVNEEGVSKSVTWRLYAEAADVHNVSFITVSPGRVFDTGTAEDVNRCIVDFIHPYEQFKPLSNYVKEKCIKATLDYFTKS